MAWHAEERPFDQDMDIKHFLQSTEEEADEAEDIDEGNEGKTGKAAALEESPSKKHPHIGTPGCLSLGHAQTHELSVQPKTALQDGVILVLSSVIGRSDGQLRGYVYELLPRHSLSFSTRPLKTFCSRVQ